MSAKSRPRMRFSMRFLQTRDADVSVDLGRGQAGVAEHFLHGAEVGAAVEQVRGEGMAELVGR